MPTELLWSNQARADLLEIYATIGLEQPAAAERYFDRIEAKAKLLKSQPRMGVRRSDIRPSMRVLVETPYLLLYRTDPDTDARRQRRQGHRRAPDVRGLIGLLLLLGAFAATWVREGR